MYYLRTKPAAQAIQFTVDKQKLSKTNAVNGSSNGSVGTPIDNSQNIAAMVCSLQNKDDCLMCGSWFWVGAPALWSLLVSIDSNTECIL